MDTVHTSMPHLIKYISQDSYEQHRMANCIQNLMFTNSRKPPNAIQNTSGPAKSESSMILASVCPNGLSTVFVFWEEKKQSSYFIPFNLRNWKWQKPTLVNFYKNIFWSPRVISKIRLRKKANKTHFLWYVLNKKKIFFFKLLSLLTVNVMCSKFIPSSERNNLLL